MRYPLQVSKHRGLYCPRCGEPAEATTPPFDNFQPLPQNATKITARLGVLLDNVRSALNVGAIFRSADGAGFANLWLCGITPTPENSPQLVKTALGAEARLGWSHHRNGLHLTEALKATGHQLLALEITPQAHSIFDLETLALDATRPITLMLGNEISGLDPALLALADHHLMIPMLGDKASLNVSVAFGVAAYAFTRHCHLPLITP